MPLPPAHQQLSEPDYEAIEAAVKETARGRWFLDEYAQRNRSADTRLVLDAIQRLQRSVLGTDMLPAPAREAPALDKELSEIELTAEKTRAALAQIETARRREGDLGKELDDIIGAQAEAISGILSDAERLEKISAAMRAEGLSPNLCDRLDGLSAHIGSACAFQDMAGQRTHKVMLALRVLEARVAALAKLWQAEPAPQPAVVIEHEAESMPAADNSAAMPEETGEWLSSEQDEDIVWEDKPVAVMTPETSSVVRADVVETKTAPLFATPSPISTKRSALDRLTFDERLALFT